MAKTKKSNAEHDVHNMVYAPLTVKHCFNANQYFQFVGLTFLITEISQGLIFIKEILTKFSYFLRFKFQNSSFVFKHPAFQI